MNNRVRGNAVMVLWGQENRRRLRKEFPYRRMEKRPFGSTQEGRGTWAFQTEPIAWTCRSSEWRELNPWARVCSGTPLLWSRRTWTSKVRDPKVTGRVTGPGPSSFMAWVGPRTGPGGTRSVYLRCFLDDEAESEANLATSSHRLKQEEMAFLGQPAPFPAGLHWEFGAWTIVSED